MLVHTHRLVHTQKGGGRSTRTVEKPDTHDLGQAAKVNVSSDKPG